MCIRDSVYGMREKGFQLRLTDTIGDAFIHRFDVDEGNLAVHILSLIHILKCCEPSDVNKLNHQACRTPLGEFAFSSVTSSGLVSTEELFLDLMNLALDSADVKCLMLLPFHQVYGNGVEEKLARCV